MLALSGGEGNRRTADVICKGFTNLFILSKGDFEAAMSEYPEAHRHMKKRAKYVAMYRIAYSASYEPFSG